MLLSNNEINSRVCQTHGNLNGVMQRMLVVFLDEAVSLENARRNVTDESSY